MQHVKDIGECELVEYFLEPMQLKKIPELKQRVYVVAEFTHLLRPWWTRCDAKDLQGRNMPL